MRRTVRSTPPRRVLSLLLLALAGGCAETPPVATADIALCPVTVYRSPAADRDIAIREAGCADRRNFAAMLANPQDLLAPRGSGIFDGGPAAAAVGRYRRDATIPLMTTPGLPIVSQPGASPSGNAGAGAAPAAPAIPAAASPGGVSP